jgi:ATP-dependent DNA ligase
MQNGGWWQYVMKPVRVSKTIFDRMSFEDYVEEAKFDGFRAILIIGPNGPVLFTREHIRMIIPNNLIPQIQELALPVGTVLDGELWNADKRGSWRHNPKVECRLTFWDAIRSGQDDLSQKPLVERYQSLQGLLSKDLPDIAIVEQFTPSAIATEELFKSSMAFRTGAGARSGFIHGVVLKRKNSPRRDHATKTQEHPDWLKIVFEGMSGWAPR